MNNAQDEIKMTISTPGREPLTVTKSQMEKALDMLEEPRDVGGIAGARLKSILERIERLEDEKKGLADDIKEVYAEAKGIGFDTPTIRRLIKERKVEPQKLNEQYELLDLYKSAIGMT